MTLSEVSKLDENGARKYLESIRWANGRVCPHCASDRSYEMKGRSTREGLYKCNACRKPFTVTIGTIFQGSHIKLREWAIAFHLMCSSKKGISAKQLQRNLGLGQYKSAWHLAHRVREAMREGAFGPKLQGDVAVDETYVGGKSRGKGRHFMGNKTPVVALVEKGGRVRTRVVADVTAKTLHAAIKEEVATEARIMTDEHLSYDGIGKHFVGGHHTVNHGAKESARGDVTTNSGGKLL
jgi:transposase-like protein